MFSNLLSYSLERISSIEHYYHKESSHITECIEKESKKYKFAYQVSQLLQLTTKDKLTEAQEKKKKDFEKEVLEYLEFPKKQPELDKGIVLFRINKKSALRQKGIELNISKGERLYKRYLEMQTIHGSSALILLITRFEEFISNYLECIYNAFPTKYIDSKPITLLEVSPLKSIDNIKELIVQREVDRKMREDYTSWFKLMEEHGLSFSGISEQLKALNELYARRNIWVHNSGIVNSSYISLVADAQLEKGVRAKITKDYITNAVNTIKIVICAIMLESCRLISKDERKRYVEEIFEVSYELLLEEAYEVAEYCFSILEVHPNLSTQVKLMSKVDRWLAIKYRKGIDAIKLEIENWDVSAYGKEFHLAKALLLNNNDEATSLLETLFLNNEMNVEMIKSWPLFKDYRTTLHYSNFKEKHKADFDMSIMEIEENREPDYPELPQPQRGE